MFDLKQNFSKGIKTEHFFGNAFIREFDIMSDIKQFLTLFVLICILNKGLGLKCGGSNVSRIVGGQDSKLLKWPWMCRMIITFETAGSFLCGASLISDQWFLTAAHCVVDEYGDPLDNIQIDCGIFDTSVYEPTEVSITTSTVCMATNSQNFY